MENLVKKIEFITLIFKFGPRHFKYIYNYGNLLYFMRLLVQKI